ncbi:VRR-NUC domain-containing protein [Dyella caseinilytica]|uniref:VRR-NUC domain-containing protein n=1 Tax=Dyella caseinilytica TaxID=1849581 RepID=A0ABX7GZH6_9GAMM|nr:VRR-NUC domain-containing protein [Dyella caseinilytica]
MGSAPGPCREGSRVSVHSAKTRPANDAFVNSEDQEQILVMRWAIGQESTWPELRWLHHCPNGEQRAKSTAVKLKAMGVKSGVPDLELPVPRGGFHGLYIEMKRTEGGRLSKEQREWRDHLTASGYEWAMCEGHVEAIAVISDYLASDGPE